MSDTMKRASITYHDYWKEVRELAQSILEETLRDLCDDGFLDPEAVRKTLDERLWETIDGHQWVIYTQYHYQVLVVSPNDDYALLNFGVDLSGGDPGVSLDVGYLIMQMAFGALYADVSEELWPLFDAWAAEQEEGA